MVPRAATDKGKGPMSPLEQASEKEEEDYDEEEFVSSFKISVLAERDHSIFCVCTLFSSRHFLNQPNEVG